ncbi:MAG: sigma-70 family RNA polymerase sigma factor [Armatimonadota bacterium]|nr:sigma-70 family RNA polymerase sigma factor [Armatimonadota bacterium]
MQQRPVADMVRRAQGGDNEAFADLVRRYQDAVFGAAYQRVLDFEAARDIAQEAFVRGYERLGDLRDPAAFPGWLLRICRNLAASWRRSPERDVERLDAHRLAAEDHAERIATRDLVSRALSALPEDNRLALTLFLVDGYTYAEVADLTEVPVTTVKGRIERGRRQLEAEVLAMTEETLRGEGPDEEFTLDTVQHILADARDAADAHKMAHALAIADDVLERLPELDAEDEERRELELEALGVVGRATFFPDRERWTTTRRRQIRILEELGDRKRLAMFLQNFAYQAKGLTKSERARISRAPEDRESDSPEAELNKIWCGQWYWWFARGVGPVAFRHEAENGITEHALLSRFDCSEQREEWLPLVEGARWEYQPAEPPEDIDVDIVVQLRHIDEDGTVYLPTTVVANRRGQ